MEAIAVAAVGLVGTLVTAWLAHGSKREAREAKENTATGNGRSAGTYLVDIDYKVDRLERRMQRTEDYLGLRPLPRGGSE